MIAELHLVSLRNEDIRATLATWHDERFTALTGNGYDPAKVKAAYVLLLGIALVDAIDDIDVNGEDFRAALHDMANGIDPLGE